MKKKIIILGGLGDGLVIAETIQKIADFELIGFLNDTQDKISYINEIPVLGKLIDWFKFSDDHYFISALHTIKKSKQRFALLQSLRIPFDRWINVIDPLSRVSSNVSFGYGNYVGPFVTIQPNVTVENFASIRAGANLGHDVSVGSFCYIGPNAVLCGRSKIKNGVHIGPCACIIDRIIVEEYSIVGSCSVVTKNSSIDQKLFGVPARELRC